MNQRRHSHVGELVLLTITLAGCPSGKVHAVDCSPACQSDQVCDKQTHTCLCTSQSCSAAGDICDPNGSGQIGMCSQGSTSGCFSVTDLGTCATAAQTCAVGASACAEPGAALQITSTTLPGGQVGTNYSAALGAAGGTPPYSWTITTGSLPMGLSLAGATGAISGMPTTSGTANFTAKVTDSANNNKDLAVSINIAPSPSSCHSGCLCPGANVWANAPLSAAQTGTFEVSFDVTPGVAGTDDSVVGLSRGVAAAYSSLAAIIRLSGTGVIDVINGASYGHTNAVPYLAGTVYHFTIDVNVPSHVADYYVTPDGGSRTTLGMSYGFRPSQASVSQLDTVNIVDSVSSASTVCNVAVAAWTPALTPVDGQCGSASGVGTTAKPTLGLCAAGTALTVTGSGPWNWTCDGMNGGSPASCQAPLASGGSCPYAAAAAGAGLVDGCSNALSSGTVVANFFTGFANGFNYPVRPQWDVAGVDYCVGAPTSGQTYADPAGGGLPAGCTYAGQTVTCSNNNTTIDGWDFTLHGGIQLVLNGSGDSVTKNKFAAGTNCVDPVIRINATSGNFTMTYNSVNGGNDDGCNGRGVFATEVAGFYATTANTYVIQYNYFTRAWQDVLDFGGGALNVRYNYFYDNGLSSNHADDFQSCGGTYPSVAIQFNTVFNSYADGYWTQPLHVESQCSSTVNNVVESQNTVVMISGNSTGCKGGANWPVNCSANGLLACKADTGTNVFNGFSAYQNYLDWTDGALQAITDGCTGNPNASNLVWGTPSPNVNLRTGATFAK